MERKKWCEWITDYYYCVQLRFPLHLRTAHGGITASETTTINQSKKPLNKTQKEQNMLKSNNTYGRDNHQCCIFRESPAHLSWTMLNCIYYNIMASQKTGPVPQLACLHSRLLTKHLVHHEMKNTPKKTQNCWSTKIFYQTRKWQQNAAAALLCSCTFTVCC